MTDVATLSVLAQASGSSIARVAYDIIDPKPWWLGFLAFRAQRWEETRQELGIDEATWSSRETRLMFLDLYHEKCAQAVQRSQQ